ncbi:HD domain-containing protein [Pontibacter sp. G13]|uniref:HD domain-containing protein n=1 Tax=Pontibacter sp. G13 TaxID=3074898 RepID=UPI0028891189|nr:HD domain-containing protein [Pontibacter sp. G13]WNJ17998.1 HD domain-containing protein [Pontibacter sp. G13]
MEKTTTLNKIINDPVHGFIEVQKGAILPLIDTPPFQRLRRIKQMGLGSLVYPGAVHSRFNHALGAMHLMRQALDTLRRKEVEISDEEYFSALTAILMHDLGHGPYSHALERVIIPGLHHERMSLALMEMLNRQFGGELDMAIDIFTGDYPRKFLHQLVSSQLDMDRMDYLIRDSFFTGVAEGIVGIDRIIKILNVHKDELVCEYKGIYSLEKFIIARRLMYWQVYLHKAAMTAEYLLVNCLKRVRELVEQGEPVFLDENLGYFFHQSISTEDLTQEVLDRFNLLDDNDIDFHLKKWQFSEDRVLSDLCKRILSRNLLKLNMRSNPIDEGELAELRKAWMKHSGCTEEEVKYYVFGGKVSNQAYIEGNHEPILVWHKSGEVLDLAEASDMDNIHALASPVTKYYICFPEELRKTPAGLS